MTRKELCPDAARGAEVLRREQELARLLAAGYERIGELRSRAERLGGSIACGYGQKNEDAMADAAARLLDAEMIWERDAAGFAGERRRISDALSAIMPEDGLLLQLRWRRRLSWLAVATRLYCGEKTARRRHERALAAFWRAYSRGTLDGEQTDGTEA